MTENEVSYSPLMYGSKKHLTFQQLKDVTLILLDELTNREDFKNKVKLRKGLNVKVMT